MGRLLLTPEFAYASGRDRGNNSMRKAGRTKWNRDDFIAAAELTNRLLAECYAPELRAAMLRNGLITA